jgi:hypothetical protein
MERDAWFEASSSSFCIPFWVLVVEEVDKESLCIRKAVDA